MADQPTTPADAQNDTSLLPCQLPRTPASQQDLSEEELRARYLEQQRRMSCPGCGESFELF
ncbi:hypothetical protein [Aeoliella sp. SH292]|uniref:hypothetical protein n=1 Tax=Aeoliella sp. SH292 TaxID=3454464 RepID=UPI003F9EB11C